MNFFLGLLAIGISSSCGVLAGTCNYGPDTCIQGYVWREAFPADHTCVPPSTRTLTSTDNSLASSRAQPGGGDFGPDTCKQDFVWREARPNDHVCVPASTRAQALADNTEGPYCVVQL